MVYDDSLGIFGGCVFGVYMACIMYEAMRTGSLAGVLQKSFW